MTEFTLAGNPNYAARIIEVKNLTTLEGLDNLRGVPIDGFQALVSNEVQVGDVLVVFPAESQIEDWFLHKFNLYRHGDKNFDQGAKGYIEDNRRVKAIRLRGHHSNALAMDAAVIGATKADVGTLFDTVDGVLLSQKYELPVKGGSLGKSAQEKAWKRVDKTFLPEHIDTENYWRNAHNIGPDEFVTVTQKLHGTSIRIGNTIVKRKPTWKDKIASFFGVPVSLTGYDVVFGSRKVIKDVNNPNQNHFYTTDIWSKEGAKYADLIPQNVVVYGELIGWTGDGPIQQGYTYNVPGKSRFPSAASATRTMVDSCTCKLTSNTANITPSGKPTPGTSADRVTSGIFGRGTRSTKRSGEQTSEGRTTADGTQATSHPSVPTTSETPRNDGNAPSLSTVSQSLSSSDSLSSAPSAGHPLDDRLSPSITTTSQASSEDSSATTATEDSVSWETARRAYAKHSSTCRVRQDLSWENEKLVRNAEAHLYIYRVAVISNDGHMYDLSWNGVKQFAFERGLNVVPELWSGFHDDFDADEWTDIRYADVIRLNHDRSFPQALPLSDKKTVDEGVVVRKEGIVPYVLKAKSPIFLGHESATLDAEVVDIEAEQSRDV